ncbi:MAG: hypothetical protein KA978_25340 [Deltaproteobacteria bacterium]|nr:hypothetical protein [Deltaproteobacteria bacterium]
MPARVVVRAPLAASLLLLAARADAQDREPAPAGLRLSWVRADGADGCPDAAELARDVARRLGRDPFAGPAAQFIEAVIRRDRDRWTASLYVRDASGALSGAREIHDDGATCAPIHGAAALAIALIIDPEAALRTAPAPAAPAPAAPAPAAPAPVPPAPRAPSQRTHRVGVLAIGVRALAAVGPLPGVAAGVALSADVHLHPRLMLTAGLWFLPEVRTPEPDSRYAFGLTAGSLSACAAPLVHARATLAACVGLALGAVHGVAYAFDPVPPGERAWLAATAGLRFTAALVGPLAAVAQVDLVAPVTRYRFYVEHVAGTVFDQAALGGAGQLGLELRFR